MLRKTTGAPQQMLADDAPGATSMLSPRSPPARTAAGAAGPSKAFAAPDAHEEKQRLAELREAAFCHRGTRGQVARRRFYQQLESSRAEPASARGAVAAAAHHGGGGLGSITERGPRSGTSSAMSRKMDAELASDEEYRALFEKYGHRLRVPRPPPPKASPRHPADAAAAPAGARRGSVTSAHQSKAGAAGYSSEALTPASRRRASDEDATPNAGSASLAFAAADGSSSADGPAWRHSSTTSAADGATDAGGAVESYGALPALQLPGDVPAALAAASAASSTAAAVAAIGRGQPSSAGPLGAQLPEPARCLMLRKDLLRKKQQAILRKTEIVHYRSHMRKHFQRILDAVEQTCSDGTGGKAQELHRNLAKLRE